MIGTHALITLPELQARLDALSAGEQLTISGSSYERLFGLDDMALSRLDNFASGHGCLVHSRLASVTFHKPPDIAC